MLSLFSRASLAAAAICLTQQAALATTVYTSRTTFNTATAALDKTANDFESLVGTPSYPENYGGGTGHQVIGYMGITVDGNNYLGNGPFGYETYILNEDVSGGLYDLDGSYSLVLGRNQGIISLDSDVFAFGFEYRLDRNQLNLPTTIEAYVIFEGGGLSQYTLNVVDGTSFFGIYASSPISLIEFQSSQGSNTSGNYVGDYTPYLLVDNVVSGKISAVPEPSQSIASGLVAGFALSIVGRRNRKKATAAI